MTTPPSILVAFRDAPALDTERLTMRGVRLDDFSDSLAMWSDPVITRFIGGKPSTPEEVWSRLLRYGGIWPLLGFGYWVLREKSSGRFVGEAGLADLRREFAPQPEGGPGPSVHGFPEAGWALASWSHGKGFATEAVRAIAEWSDAQLRAPRTVCLISPENAASIRVAEKGGYREFARALYKGSPSILFERFSNLGAAGRPR